MTRPSATEVTFDFVVVKGFGDLVIALTCLRRTPLEERGRVRLLIGQHLRPLFDALDPPLAATVFPHPDAGPAALFQVRSRRPAEIVRSALGVRRALGRVRDRAGVLVFDEWDVRHRFLSLGRAATALPTRDNLYRSWRDFMAAEGLAEPAPPEIPAPGGRRLHIFPGAREEERRFPPALLRELVNRATGARLEPRIFTIAGEMPHLAEIGLPVEELPRDFGRTLAAVADADRVISADSMTGHLAEYCGLPVYVCWPREKYYWLPLSAAESGRHALFTEKLDATTLPAFLA